MASRTRVWIVQYNGPRPEALHQVPPDAKAIEPAEAATMTPRRARRYVEAFNRAAQRGSKKIWAVAIPVTARYEGEPKPGETLLSCQMKPNDRRQ